MGFWCITSVLYFAFTQFGHQWSFLSENGLNRLIILASILLRNLGAFFSQSLQSLYLAYQDEDAYYQDDRINTKLHILSLDVVMTHQLPFSYFKKYVFSEAPYYAVYVNFYMLIQIYRVKVKNLLKSAQHLCAEARLLGQKFDPKNIIDGEYQAKQILVGRSMLNMLEYIKQNYNSHFKGLIINDIGKLDLNAFEDDISDNSSVLPTKSTFLSQQKTERSVSANTNMANKHKFTLEEVENADGAS